MPHVFRSSDIFIGNIARTAAAETASILLEIRHVFHHTASTCFVNIVCLQQNRRFLCSGSHSAHTRRPTNSTRRCFWGLFRKSDFFVFTRGTINFYFKLQIRLRLIVVVVRALCAQSLHKPNLGLCFFGSSQCIGKN